ncbi:molybdopterin molybdenumtransferase MoeA [Bacillus sp. FJAT-42376]|uniref:molybdopterin molybdotransferase MoeA n=1 Tax=Bacillus sp. FJAT-42376 TaxID=2014076 RepID=UPI000F4FCB77|nr:gephyrin-like molybdotransferase Glp [Bacillus sp. FJAT-42376]AZB43120.1 molybdopterin molybdenumtransferase MoeA [Bacillus sp. FJAT-42376]
MLEKRTPIPVSEAVKKVASLAKSEQIEMVPIEQAYGRFLGEDLTADHDVPAFDRSPYDGFAVRSEDTESGHPVMLEVAGEIGAGSLYLKPAEPGQAVRIMTGAAIPEGFDAVVMLELAKEHTISGKKMIELNRSYKKGENVSFRGEDTEKGTVLVKKGTPIHAGISALLATFGYHEVPVSKKPVVGVLATGSELLNVDEPLEPGKIRNSNAYMIFSQLERAGADVRYFGKLDDEFETCFETIKNAIEQVDMLITTGGVSVGDYDYLPAIYEKLGAAVLFNKVAMRPGSVTTAAEWNGKLLFGLSGNPSACYVGFELFVRPVIRIGLGSGHPHLKKIKAVLGADFKKANPFMRFVRGKLEFNESGSVTVTPSGFNKSSAVSSLAEADTFIVLPGGTRGYEKGMTVDAFLLNDVSGSEWPWENILPSYR